MRHLLALILLLTLTGCSLSQPPAPEPPSATEQPPTPEPPPQPLPPLKVALPIDEGRALASYVGPGQYEGFYVDIVQAVGDRMGRTLLFLDDPFARRDDLTSQKIDLLVGQEKVGERQDLYGWIPFANWSSKAIFFKKTGSNVGLVREPAFPLTTLNPTHEFASWDPILGSRRKIHMVVRHEDEELRAAIEQAIRDIKNDGTLRRLSEQWFHAYDEHWFSVIDPPGEPPAPPTFPITYIKGFSPEGPDEVAFGNGIYMGGDAFNRILAYSTDGQRWTRVEDLPGIWADFLFVSGQFVAVDADGSVAVSADGINWEVTLTDPQAWFTDIAFGDGLFVITGGEGLILTSSDARTWTRQQIATEDLFTIWHRPDGWVVQGRKGTYSSPDGEKWSPSTAQVGVCGNGVCVTTGHFYSAQGLAIGHGMEVGTSIAFGEGIFLAAGSYDNPKLWWSANGQDWYPARDLKGGERIWYLDNRFVLYQR